MKPSQITDIDQNICGTIWTSPHAASMRDRICYDIGARATASKSFRQAQELVSGALQKAGASNVHTEPVPVFAWNDRGAELSLVKPQHRIYDTCQHVHTTPADVTGPLVEVIATDDTALDCLGSRLEGAVVVLGGPGITTGNYRPLVMVARNLVQRGVVGLIMYNAFAHMGPAQRHLGVVDALSIPAVGISNDAGRELAELARGQGGIVRMVAAGYSQWRTCSNLIAELGSTRRTGEVILLNAHLDSLPITPGALDNLSGVLALIEIVRALAPHQDHFRRSLRLLLPTAEEYGLVGSAHYVKAHRNELDDICFNFSLDTLTPETAGGIAVMWAPAMRDLIEKTMFRAGRPSDVRDHYCQGSDYLPFMLQGIAAARAADWEGKLPPWCHTTADDAQNLPAHWIQLNAMSYAQLLLRLLTQGNPLPTRRKSGEEVATLVASEGAGDYMKFLQLMP